MRSPRPERPVKVSGRAPSARSLIRPGRVPAGRLLEGLARLRDHQFCLLTMAISPLHTDVHFAETEMEGGRNIVVGTYIYALLLGMSVPDISGRAIANLGAEHLRHVAPFHHGDSLYGMTEVTGVRMSQSRPGAGVLTVNTTGINQDGVVVCTFTRSVLVPRRPAP